MAEFVHLTPDFAIGPQVAAEDFAALAAAGFASVLNLRPDDEAGHLLPTALAEPLARAAGLGYAACPADNHAIFEPDLIAAFESQLAHLPRPILAHCKSGNRAAILWALVAARYQPVDNVIATLRAAGQDLDFLEDELREAEAETRSSPFQLKNDPLLGFGRSALL